ncbi:MAG: microcin C transport system permease protein [Elusimicrobia bacterium]|nr:MAG: microcin C transport system permease protein [Elusimicrobiota bacterium]KAF0154649.1 MAG: microcin C transport system permease protein [Elusimicrobiota bacterium]
MTGQFIGAIIVLAAGYLLTHKLVPAVILRAGLALGFDMKPAPHWQKRFSRFRGMKRGYYSFLIITTLFVTSFFLEFIVNSKPLMIRYESRVSFPAFREWSDKLFFFADLRRMERKADFGQVGDDEVDYRLFAAAKKDPSVFDRQLELLRAERADFEKQVAAYRTARLSTPEEKQDYADLRAVLPVIDADMALVERARGVFAAGRASIIMPLYPYAPREHLLDLPGTPPHRPNKTNLLGTDDSGADVFAQLAYGFRISLSFALIVSVTGYIIGIIIGGVMGYFGGWTDILIQRVIEIWASIPFLFTIMIIASIVQPTFGLLVGLLVVLHGWIGMTYYMRGEFYREKARDYVHAAEAMGATDWSVMMKHILPNSLVPIVTFAPFAIVAYIGQLVSLDFLGFGLPVGTPSWGSLISQGMQYIKLYPNLILTPSIALAVTLFLVVQIGEAVREAFDPKVFSRLR